MTPERFRGSLISHFSRRITQRGGINLAQGKPGFEPPPELIRRLCEAANEPALHQYAPGNGNLRLLELLTARLSSADTPLDEGNLLIVQGATEGLFLALFHLFYHLGPGAGVLSFDPAYESFPRLPQILGMPYHAFSTGADGDVDFAALEATVRKRQIRVILLASPGNPLGKIWSRDELCALATILERVDGWLIFDAVYAGIYFDSAPADPLELGFQKLIRVDSFSKRLSITGWRVGHMVAPQKTMAAIRADHDYTGLSAPSLAQAALARYLEANDFGSEYTRDCRMICARNHAFMSHELAAAGFRVAPARGGYFVWARIPQAWSDGFSLAESLLEAGVGVVPGENFSDRYRDFIRLNIAMDSETVTEAASRIRAHSASGS